MPSIDVFIYKSFLAPYSAHVLECFALGLGNKFLDEDGRHDTQDTIQAVGEQVAHLVALMELKVEHGHKRRADNPVENPLEGDCNSDGLATYRIGENLGDEHPADGSPAEHEACTVEQERNHA